MTIEALIREHAPAIYRVALRLTANAADAEEVLQDVCLKLARELASFRGEARLSTWLHRVTVNAALMHLRKAKRHASVPLDDVLPTFDATDTLARRDVDYAAPARADELLARHELARLALDALAALPWEYRAPFVLRDLEGMDPADAAALLGLEPAALRQRVHRARLALRARLAREMGGES